MGNDRVLKGLGRSERSVAVDDASIASTGGPRWLADEMLGRLARYLRFLGHDTEYARGLTDAEIVQKATAEGRVLVTRDRALATSTSPAVLLTSVELGEQLNALRSAFPHAHWTVRFERCSICNAPLGPWTPPTDEDWPEEVPKELVDAGLPVFECSRCGQRYWEGSHARRIRAQFAQWFPSGDP
jgi:uncharacterized protein with PIN domain